MQRPSYKSTRRMVLVLAMFVSSIAGCTQPYRLRVLQKDTVERCPSSFLGYYATNWMPVENFGAVGWSSCQQPGCCVSGECHCNSTDGQVPLATLATPEAAPTEAGMPLVESAALENVPDDDDAPTWLHMPAYDPAEIPSAKPPGAVVPWETDSANWANVSKTDQIVQVIRLPKPASVQEAVDPIRDTFRMDSGPKAFFVGGRLLIDNGCANHGKPGERNQVVAPFENGTSL